MCLDSEQGSRKFSPFLQSHSSRLERAWLHSVFCKEINEWEQICHHQRQGVPFSYYQRGFIRRLITKFLGSRGNFLLYPFFCSDRAKPIAWKWLDGFSHFLLTHKHTHTLHKHVRYVVTARCLHAPPAWSEKKKGKCESGSQQCKLARGKNREKKGAKNSIGTEGLTRLPFLFSLPLTLDDIHVCRRSLSWLERREKEREAFSRLPHVLNATLTPTFFNTRLLLLLADI